MDQLKEKHFDTSRGFCYRYYISDAAEADQSRPAILLCHGWPDSADLWQYMVQPLLKSKLRLIAPDLLGAGGTSKPIDPKAYNIQAMVDDVVEILEAEGIDGPVIPFGHDHGSYFAHRFYMLQAPRCAGLISLCIAYAPPSATFDLDALNAATEKHYGYPLYPYWHFFLDPDTPALFAARADRLWRALHGDAPDWMRRMFCELGAMRAFLLADDNEGDDPPLKPYAQDPRLRDAWLATARDSGGFAAQLNWYRALTEGIQGEVEVTLDPVIAKPYLFIGATGDAVCRADLIDEPKRKGYVPRVTERMVEAGHWCAYERPEEVAAMVREWLEGEGFAAAG